MQSEVIDPSKSEQAIAVSSDYLRRKPANAMQMLVIASANTIQSPNRE
jgi:hypothetical protein